MPSNRIAATIDSGADVIGLYQSGFSVSRLAEAFGVRPSTVRKRLVDGGVSEIPHGNTIETDDLQLKRDYLDNVLTLQQIADGHGIGLGTAYRRLKAMGVEMRKPGAKGVAA